MGMICHKSATQQWKYIMIESLTDEQMTKFPEYVQKWIDIGTSTDTNREEAEAAINLSYTCAGLTPPKEIIWFKCPKTMIEYMNGDWGELDFTKKRVWGSVGRYVSDSFSQSISVPVWSSVKNAVQRPIRDTVWHSIGDTIWNSVWDSYTRSSWDAVRDSSWGSTWDSRWSPIVFGHHDTTTSPFDYFRNELNLIEETNPLHGLIALAKSCGWIIPCSSVCLASDKPIVCELDHNNVLHNDSGPAIVYADGLVIYAFHGTVVPKSWVMDTPDVKDVLTESNIEVRAAGMEILGWANMLDHLDAKLIDKDDDPLIGALYSVKLPDLEGRHLIVKYTCPRNGVMGQPVPDENHLNGEKITTILGAKAWLAESTLSEYMPPEIRT